MTAFDLSTCARPNILKLVPYRCARDDYKDDGTNILLDANENAFGPSLPSNLSLTSTLPTSTLHRYPDPHQHALKQKFCNLRGGALTPSNLFLGVGSDEAIDALLRAFCIPGKDKILTCPPTYGMYAVSACVNDIDIVKVPLKVTEPGFPVDVDAIERVLSETEGIKLVYLCSPGNPTGSLVDPEAVKRLLAHPTWNGVVVVDEAYVDFAPQGSSLAPWVTEYPNLVVMQTLSKAFGLAGIRLGAAFTSVEIAKLLNSLKAPYSVSSPTSELAMVALTEESGLKVQRQNVEGILRQRDRLVQELPKIEGIGRFLGGFESNFLLCEMLDRSGKPSNVVAEKVYAQLAETRGVVVRFRGKELGCEGCLRITIGTGEENDRLLERLAEVLKQVREE
ncbi:histidinol-phosphate aminotransferase [Ascodesmis nigricans]|uniref:histidinol-phosphate transaminase n=1 Tax=Ascodesmis nigricans TaxID=341454 RepID=A0A4S2N548_9PEZI|nr:histidinol-phosphate aminotransferase [Ascodesmis nigricans]